MFYALPIEACYSTTRACSQHGFVYALHVQLGLKHTFLLTCCGGSNCIEQLHVCLQAFQKPVTKKGH